jgi:hypothetical protein
MKGHGRTRPNCRFSCSIIVVFIFLFISCSHDSSVALEASPPSEQLNISKTGFVIQVGAFSNLDNAVRLTLSLNAKNLGAYYFKHESGLYKVRLGSYLSRPPAEENAERLRQAGFIQEYFIVSPETFAISQSQQSGLESVRKEIVTRAHSFLGLPYRWGGLTAEKGFDCSGLTMAVYDLVGLRLPRTSLAQFRSGIPVSKESLDRGDLVFFLGQNRNRIAHVGIYTGDGNFIHAPGKNKIIRVESLSNRYFQNRFAGARTYLSQDD